MYIAYFDRETGQLKPTEYTSEKYSFKELSEIAIKLNAIENSPKYWLISDD